MRFDQMLRVLGSASHASPLASLLRHATLRFLPLCPFLDPVTDSKMEMVGENTFTDQKAHYRCRRKKHDCRMVDSLR